MESVAITFISDNRYTKLVTWLSNSIKNTNPDMRLIVIDINSDEYKDFEFVKWDLETKEHPLRVSNRWGILKYMAALEVMEKENISSALILGADVIVCDKLDIPDLSDSYDILVTSDIAQSQWITFNPDVQFVYGTNFLRKAVDKYKLEMENHTNGKYDYIQQYSLEVYGEMALLCSMCINNEVRYIPMEQVIPNSTASICFNMNVREIIHEPKKPFSIVNGKIVIQENSDVPIKTIHIQAGLGNVINQFEFDSKVYTTMIESHTLSHEDVRDKLRELCEDTTMFHEPINLG